MLGRQIVKAVLRVSNLLTISDTYPWEIWEFQDIHAQASIWRKEIEHLDLIANMEPRET